MGGAASGNTAPIALATPPGRHREPIASEMGVLGGRSLLVFSRTAPTPTTASCARPFVGVVFVRTAPGLNEVGGATGRLELGLGLIQTGKGRD